jgi:F-type H+-transporting ATPase subunit gamma
METLEVLRRQLDTFEDLQSLVRTMKALAAVEIHHNEHAVRSLRIYYRTIELGFQVVLHDFDPWPRTPHVPHEAPQGAVIFGSDHGLCGRFNDEIASHAAEKILVAREEGAQVRVLAVGARLVPHLERAGVSVDVLHSVPASTTKITAAVRRALLVVDEWRQAGIERVRVFYNRHVSTAVHEPCTQRMLPVDFERFRDVEQEPWESRSLPTYSMDRTALLAALLRQYFFVTLFTACAESIASENGARLVAMQAAEKNLSERRMELAAEFRRVRQDKITSELLDVVSGFEIASERSAEPGDTNY